MAKQVFNSVSDFCKNVTRGTLGITMVTMTIPKLKKTNNPYFGRVMKITYMTNLALGYDYENTLNNRLKKKDIDVKYKSEKSNGRNWCLYPYILQADRDENIKYLRCVIRNDMTIKTAYLLDGNIVGGDLLSDIKQYCYKSNNYCKKQAEYGLSKEEQVNTKDYLIDGVLLLKQGEKEYRKIDENISIDMIKKIFE